MIANGPTSITCCTKATASVGSALPAAEKRNFPREWMLAGQLFTQQNKG